ncbi:hypothetical protein [Paenibacillus hamazuiensis]|uniref:hypothetical protein n=1 Tax=Paenibacillus hamazuiensis TaxID=2936508 RepID=UPI00200D91EB|nr:hypothetical protein [Paenibacillus hamazuiensis]
MARRNKNSISMFLVSFLGFLMMCKVFVWVLESQIMHVPIRIPELDYAIVVALLALLLRVGFVLWVAQRKKAAGKGDENLSSATSFPDPSDLNMCVVCKKTVSEKVKQYCLNRPDRFTRVRQ